MRSRNSRKELWVRILSVMLIASVGSAFAACKKKEETGNTSSDISSLAESRNILWGDGLETPEDGYTTWKNLNVSFGLKQALESNTGNVTYALQVYHEHDPKFVYKGKTIEEYEINRQIESGMPNALEMLLEDGEYLKYGAQIYETGVPDGTQWTKEYYEQRVEMYRYYGVLDKYIVNGKFLKEEVEKDLPKAREKIKNDESFRLLIEANNAEVQAWADSLSKTYEVEVVDTKEIYELILFMTKEELLDFVKPGEEDKWVFYLALKNG